MRKANIRNLYSEIVFMCSAPLYNHIGWESEPFLSKQKLCTLNLIRQRWLLKLRQDIAGVIGRGIARLFSISRRHCLQKIKTWCMCVISKLTEAKAFLPLFKEKERKSTVKRAGFASSYQMINYTLFTHEMNFLERAPRFFLFCSLSVSLNRNGAVLAAWGWEGKMFRI